MNRFPRIFTLIGLVAATLISVGRPALRASGCYADEDAMVNHTRVDLFDQEGGKVLGRFAFEGDDGGPFFTHEIQGVIDKNALQMEIMEEGKKLGAITFRFDSPIEIRGRHLSLILKPLGVDWRALLVNPMQPDFSRVMYWESSVSGHLDGAPQLFASLGLERSTAKLFLRGTGRSVCFGEGDVQSWTLIFPMKRKDGVTTIGQGEGTILPLAQANADVKNREGMRAYREGSNDEAIKLFSEAISLYPNHFLAHTNLASVYALAGKSNESMAQLEEAATLDFRRTSEKMESDTDYDPIRHLPAFKELQGKLGRARTNQ
jgi:hypothetical protein